MNPTGPDPLPPSTTEQDSRDESLGTQLDQYLESLREGTSANGPGRGDAELDALGPIVGRLFKLSQGLSAPTTVEYRVLSSKSTVDVPRSREDTSQDYKQPGAAAVGATPAQVGKFHVLRPLGHGGQAATLLASDPDLRRHIVLKVYHSAHTRQEQDAVLHEGQALARVRSPYVAQCYSAEREDGVPFLVMEYIPGRNLADEHHAHPLTVAQALDVVGKLAEGLAAVHACGLLHRDVKPGNVLMGEDGNPRLVDFGLAAALASDDLAHLSGTLAYMAPEQARRQAERIDARSDVYGLGAVLYDLLTGRPPHLGSTRSALLEAASLGDVTPLARLNPKVPRAVNDLCMRCLARDPAARFASAADLAAAVRRLQGPRPVRWPWFAAAGASLAVAATLVAVLLSGSGPPHTLDNPATIKRPVAELPGNKGERKKDNPVVKDETPPPFRPAYLKGRPPRRDFGLTVKPVGSRVDPKDRTHLLTDGQEVSFEVEVSRDAYIGVWNVTPKRVYQLFPNDEDGNNLARAGKPLTVPGNVTKRIVARAAPYTEYVHVIASTRPLREDDVPRLRAGAFRASDGPAEREQDIGKLRELEMVDARDLKLGTLAVAEVIVPFRVLKQQE